MVTTALSPSEPSDAGFWRRFLPAKTSCTMPDSPLITAATLLSLLRPSSVYELGNIANSTDKPWLPTGRNFQSPKFARHCEASLVTCDGKPVLWASHLLGKPLPQSVTGSDLLPALCKYGASQSIKVALIGGPPGTAAAAGRRLVETYPGVNVVWTYCPPLGFEHDARQSDFIVGEISRTDPDLVFVGVGAPKQEKWRDRIFQI